MDFKFIIGAVIFFISIIAARFVAEKGYKKISDEEKVLLMDNFSKFRKISIIPLFGGLLIYFGVIYFLKLNPQILMIVFMSYILVYLILMLTIVFKKMKELNLDKGFIRNTAFSFLIRFVGIITFIVIIFLKIKEVKK